MTLPKQVTQFFKGKIEEFSNLDDPMLEMLKMLLSELMKAESETLIGAEKNKHSKQRKTYFSGYRTR